MEIKELMEKKGNIIGEIFHLNYDYIYRKEGLEGVKKVELEVKKLTGNNFDFKEIGRFSWQPLGLSVIVVLAAKKLFQWDDKDIFEMGASTAKVSFILRLVSYLNQPEEVLKRSPNYWKRYYDFGAMEIKEFDKEKKRIVVRLTDFSFHPVWCLYTAGYFLSVVSFFIKGKDMKIKETQCSHQGGLFEEYLIEWQ
jgi:hypothetical protein